MSARVYVLGGFEHRRSLTNLQEEGLASAAAKSLIVGRDFADSKRPVDEWCVKGWSRKGWTAARKVEVAWTAVGQGQGGSDGAPPADSR